MPDLVINDLAAGYRGRASVFRHVSLTISGPGLFRLTGKNGIGKSTLCEVLSGYLPAREGSVSFNGVHLQANFIEFVTLIRSRPLLVPYMSVIDNLILFGKRFGTSQEQMVKFATDLGIEEHLDKIPSELSTGTLRKTWLLCGLQSRNPVLLFDEPFNGVDEASMHVFVDMLSEKMKVQLIVVISHILPPWLHTQYIVDESERSQALNGPFGLEQIIG